MSRKTVFIAGAGQAGAVCAMALRDKGFQGEIVLAGEEPHAPYERPELSKKLVSGGRSLADVTILDAAKAESLGIRLLTGCTVSGIDRDARKVGTDTGSFSYDWLVLATGGRARALPGTALTGLPVVSVRKAEDAEQLKALIASSRSVAVIGGGWLGLEAAASCRQAGLEVDVLEMAPRPCARVAPPALSEALSALHAANGIRLHCGAGFTFVPGGIRLADDTALTPDFLIAAIGMEANDGLAAAAGLATDRGIVVDSQFRTSDPSIFAIGDCAVATQSDGSRLRLESWQNANVSGLAVACAITGTPLPAPEPLWFWSDQFDAKVQMAGSLEGADEIILRGSGTEQMAFHLTEGRLTGAWALNCARDFALARRWLAQGTRLAADRLADGAQPLKACTAA